MSKAGTIYLITNYKFNHDSSTHALNEPIDDRFLKSRHNYVYYLVDNKIPFSLRDKPCILENSFDLLIKKVGKTHLAEWATLIAERRYRFATYPMYITSSRFYQKNRFLQLNLNDLWEELFQGLDTFDYAMLPSYDRPLRWIYPRYKDTHIKYQSRYAFFPFKRKAFDLIESLYGIKIERDLPHFTDFFCDYFGFKTFDHFAKYMDFNMPMIDHFLTKDFELKVDLSEYFHIGCSTHRAEKPITFLLEYFSHLFFALKKQPFFAHHYTGLYEIYTHEKKIVRQKKFHILFSKRVIRRFHWMWMWVWLQSGWPKPIQRIAVAPFTLLRLIVRKLKIKPLLIK